jgi:hypothetical protein
VPGCDEPAGLELESSYRKAHRVDRRLPTGHAYRSVRLARRDGT